MKPKKLAKIKEFATSTDPPPTSTDRYLILATRPRHKQRMSSFPVFPVSPIQKKSLIKLHQHLADETNTSTLIDESWCRSGSGSDETNTSNDDTETTTSTSETLATNYGNADYWNDRYLRYSPFDWLITFEAFKAQQLNSFMNATDAILMLGCGSAAFSADLYDDGYTNITNIDLSDVVIAQMKEANDKDRPGMTWAVMDVTSLSYENAHYDVVFDKSTMDCLFCCDDSSHIISEMMCEAWRVLKPGGLFISLSLHDVDKVLPYVDSNEQGYDLDW